MSSNNLNNQAIRTPQFATTINTLAPPRIQLAGPTIQSSIVSDGNPWTTFTTSGGTTENTPLQTMPTVQLTDTSPRFVFISQTELPNTTGNTFQTFEANNNGMTNQNNQISSSVQNTMQMHQRPIQSGTPNVNLIMPSSSTQLIGDRNNLNTFRSLTNQGSERLPSALNEMNRQRLRFQQQSQFQGVFRPIESSVTMADNAAIRPVSPSNMPSIQPVIQPIFVPSTQQLFQHSVQPTHPTHIWTSQLTGSQGDVPAMNQFGVRFNSENNQIAQTIPQNNAFQNAFQRNDVWIPGSPQIRTNQETVSTMNQQGTTETQLQPNQNYQFVMEGDFVREFGNNLFLDKEQISNLRSNQLTSTPQTRDARSTVPMTSNINMLPPAGITN